MRPGWAAAAAALGLWGAALFALVGAPEVPGFQCYTDYKTEVVCHWDAENTTDCARHFRMSIINNVPRSPNAPPTCTPKKRRIPESASPGCFCVIRETMFFGTWYTFLLETGTNKSKELTKIYLGDIVRPQALTNLVVTKSKKRSFILAWDKGYKPGDFLYSVQSVTQIRISAEGQMPELRNIREQTNNYEIFTDGLLPRKNYTASVRYTLSDREAFWSEWSSPCWWINDFGPEPGDQRWWLILLACFLVMVLVSTTYRCFVRLKRKWWDEIPSPSKSHTAEDVGKKPRLVPWQIFLGDEGKDSSGQGEAFLTPEVPSVEPSLTICSPIADPGPGTQTEEEEEEEEGGHILRDAALAGLFQDILWGEECTEDAETSTSVQEEPPPAGTPEPALGGLCLPGGTPRKTPRGSSEFSYQNSEVATSSQAASPGPRQPQGPTFAPSPYKLLLLAQQLPSTPCQAVVRDDMSPQADGQGSGWAKPPQPSCYKSFSSLEGQLWEPQGNFSGVGQAQPLSSGPLSHEWVLFSPPQQEDPSQNVSAIPCVADAGLPGYRPLRAASRDPCSLCLGSSYKPLLEVFKTAPQESPLGPTLRGTQEAEEERGGPAPWEGPLTSAFSQCWEEGEGEEDSGPERLWQGAEGFLPQMPVAIW